MALTVEGQGGGAGSNEQAYIGRTGEVGRHRGSLAKPGAELSVSCPCPQASPLPGRQEADALAAPPADTANGSTAGAAYCLDRRAAGVAAPTKGLGQPKSHLCTGTPSQRVRVGSPFGGHDVQARPAEQGPECSCDQQAAGG